MSISSSLKKELITKYGKNQNDTGSVEVQVAILTEEIKALTTHMIANKKDMISKRGLNIKVSRRKNLLAYLERIDIERYRKLVKDLKLRS